MQCKITWRSRTANSEGLRILCVVSLRNRSVGCKESLPYGKKNIQVVIVSPLWNRTAVAINVVLYGEKNRNGGIGFKSYYFLYECRLLCRSV
jgi:hypothetical protein